MCSKQIKGLTGIDGIGMIGHCIRGECCAASTTHFGTSASQMLGKDELVAVGTIAMSRMATKDIVNPEN